MFEFEHEIYIDRPVVEVFGFVGNPETLPQWNHHVRSVTKTSKGPTRFGATFHQVRRDDEQRLRVAAYQEHSHLTLETVPPSKPALRRELRFRAQGLGTRLVDRWQLEMDVPKLLEPLAARRTRAGIRENLNTLKLLLERGPVTLQEGSEATT